MKKPQVNLAGEDGNVFSILGLCRKAARKAGWTDEQWKKVQSEMMSGDYNHVLQTAMKYFQVS